MDIARWEAFVREAQALRVTSAELHAYSLSIREASRAIRETSSTVMDEVARFFARHSAATGAPDTRR